jgi:hypothetical protein
MAAHLIVRWHSWNGKDAIFCDNKNKGSVNERKYVITEARLHICPVSQYRREVNKKLSMGEFFCLIIHMKIS